MGGSDWNQSCPSRLLSGNVIALVVRATGGWGGERDLLGVSWGSLSAWLSARGKLLWVAIERTLALSEVYLLAILIRRLLRTVPGACTRCCLVGVLGLDEASGS